MPQGNPMQSSSHSARTAGEHFSGFPPAAAVGLTKIAYLATTLRRSMRQLIDGRARPAGPAWPGKDSRPP